MFINGLNYGTFIQQYYVTIKNEVIAICTNM